MNTAYFVPSTEVSRSRVRSRRRPVPVQPDVGTVVYYHFIRTLLFLVRLFIGGNRTTRR